MVADSYKIFKDGFTVYLFDRKKNFGDWYLMEEMATDTAEAMDALGIELARACLDFETYANPENVTCPTFVLGAKLDQTLGVIASREIAEALKQNGTPVELYVYENYGHAVNDEAPDYRKRILEFLNR